MSSLAASRLLAINRGARAGKFPADPVTGSPPCVDPEPFRYSRYFDGTDPQPTMRL
jgi:hypothetical protein